MALKHGSRKRARFSFLGGSAAFALLAALVTSGGTARAAARAASSAIVGTESGPVGGTRIARMHAWLGIPYAAPPVGALRWRPPHPHAPWSQPIAATRFANHCPQPAGPFGRASSTEDCLYLNVFAPETATPASRLPVMFWIHGGGFVVGESDDYDPARLVARGVVVVTINYRLGRLGFFAQRGLDAEDHSLVNYGLMDQQSALKWVKRNIAAFGGNPGRTTIFGESAGGLSVFSNLVSPTAAHLFEGAIVESGAYQTTLPTLAASESAGNAVAATLGCSNQSAGCLRSLSAAQVIANEPALTVPTVDGTILTQSPSTALATGAFNRVPVIDGSNHDEYRLFTALYFDFLGSPITAATYPAVVAGSVGAAAAPAVLAAYPLSRYASPDIAFSAIETDAVFSCPALGADVLLSHYVPTFAYEFADENAPEPFLPPATYPYGAAHASELQFLFENFLKPNPPLTPAERRLADTMVDDWTTFAKTHEAWRAFSPSRPTFERFVPPAPFLSYQFEHEHHCALWAALLGG